MLDAKAPLRRRQQLPRPDHLRRRPPRPRPPLCDRPAKIERELGWRARRASKAGLDDDRRLVPRQRMVVAADPRAAAMPGTGSARRMKMLVTGSGGQLARSLAERAHGRAASEARRRRPAANSIWPSRQRRRCYRSDRPHVVINAAAYTAVDQAEDEPDLAFRINADAAGESRAAAAGGRRAPSSRSRPTMFSTAGRRGRMARTRRRTPLGVYGRSKLEGEERVRAANPRAS